MGAITRKISQTFLAKNNDKNLKSYPQVACYAFDIITAYIHLDGRYEVEELDFLAKSIFPQLAGSRVCLDIGANIGNHSLLFAEHFQNVISFEPHPRTFKLLDFNSDLVDNITPLNIGLSDKKSTETAHFPRHNIGSTSLNLDVSTSDPELLEQVEFNLDKLDDIPEVQAADKIDFVKIDVEGHEEACIAGALKTLKKHKPVIGIEILGARIKNGETPALETLKDVGYNHFYNMKSNRPLSWAPKVITRLATVFLGLFFNYRPLKSFTLEPLVLLEGQDYPIVLCSTAALN